MHGVRPLASNGVTRRDLDRLVATSPIRRDHGKATGSSVLKEEKDMKHRRQIEGLLDINYPYCSIYT